MYSAIPLCQSVAHCFPKSRKHLHSLRLQRDTSKINFWNEESGFYIAEVTFPFHAICYNSSCQQIDYSPEMRQRKLRSKLCYRKQVF